MAGAMNLENDSVHERHNGHRREETARLKDIFASAANMPKDVVLGASVITVLGNMEVCVENYRGIIEYTDCLIRVQAKGKQIRIAGKHLKIEYYTNDEMKITGYIGSIEFCKC